MDIAAAKLRLRCVNEWHLDLREVGAGLWAVGGVSNVPDVANGSCQRRRSSSACMERRCAATSHPAQCLFPCSAKREARERMAMASSQQPSLPPAEEAVDEAAVEALAAAAGPAAAPAEPVLALASASPSACVTGDFLARCPPAFFCLSHRTAQLSILAQSRHWHAIAAEPDHAHQGAALQQQQ